MTSYSSCQSCGHNEMEVFYKHLNVPTHCVMLHHTKEDAIQFPSGNLTLAFCPNCGFIQNKDFNPNLLNYSEDYEETQGFSPTFQTFHKKLADHLIQHYNLKGKHIIEIGCGKGEFLSLLCELGNNVGVGFDPAFVEARTPGVGQIQAKFIKDFYSEKYLNYKADFFCCKMTLEHIPDTAKFIRMLYNAVRHSPGSIIFFQVPEVLRILEDLAFWDIYYEHCSYFSPGSLARLFRSCGFEVLEIWKDYDDQYLMIEAKIGQKGNKQLPLIQENDMDRLRKAVNYFSIQIPKLIENWNMRIHQFRKEGKRLAIWGAGSKAVAFLTSLDNPNDIQITIDINPYKQNTYLAGTGHKIVGPDFLRTYKPDVVIIMNPIYKEEIEKMLTKMGLSPILITV